MHFLRSIIIAFCLRKKKYIFNQNCANKIQERSTYIQYTNNEIRQFIRVLECFVLLALPRSGAIILKSSASAVAAVSIYNESWIIMVTNPFNIIYFICISRVNRVFSLQLTQTRTKVVRSLNTVSEKKKRK